MPRHPDADEPADVAALCRLPAAPRASVCMEEARGAPGLRADGAGLYVAGGGYPLDTYSYGIFFYTPLESRNRVQGKKIS